MIRKSHTNKSAGLVKERALNAIRVDHDSQKYQVIKEPLQPYMAYILDVASTIIAHKSNDNKVSLTNKSMGLGLRIEKLLDGNDMSKDRYRITLYSGNKIRFSGIAMNANGGVGINQWVFTEKNEDTVSRNDIDQFIFAASLLSAKGFTEKCTDLQTLILWALIGRGDVKTFMFDDTSKVVFNDSGSSIDIEMYMQDMYMQDILIMTCQARPDPDNTYELEHVNINHAIPAPVIVSLSETIKASVREKYQANAIAQIQAAQEAFYITQTGAHYGEAAQLNDIFKQYT